MNLILLGSAVRPAISAGVAEKNTGKNTGIGTTPRVFVKSTSRAQTFPGFSFTILSSTKKFSCLYQAGGILSRRPRPCQRIGMITFNVVVHNSSLKRNDYHPNSLQLPRISCRNPSPVSTPCTSTRKKRFFQNRIWYCTLWVRRTRTNCRQPVFGKKSFISGHNYEPSRSNLSVPTPAVL